MAFGPSESGRFGFVLRPRPTLRRPLTLATERIENPDPGTLVVPFISGHDSQAMQQSGRGNLFIECVLGMGHTQTSPHLSTLHIESEDAVLVITQHLPKPAFQLPGLAPVTPMPDDLDAAAQFTYGDHRQVHRRLLGFDARKESLYSRIGLVLLAQFAENIRVNQVHAGLPRACLRPFDRCVAPKIAPGKAEAASP